MGCVRIWGSPRREDKVKNIIKGILGDLKNILEVMYNLLLKDIYSFQNYLLRAYSGSGNEDTTANKIIK